MDKEVRGLGRDGWGAVVSANDVGSEEDQEWQKVIEKLGSSLAINNGSKCWNTAAISHSRLFWLGV